MSHILSLLVDMDRRRRHPDQQFMVSLSPEDVVGLISPQCSNDYFRNWKQFAPAPRGTGTTIKCDKNKFQVNVDVQHFAPEEISVKTVDGFIVIEAKHEEKRDDHGWVSRQFVRRYPLPEGCNIDSVQSRLSSDGVLVVTAPLERPQTANERIVPIIQTGPVKTRPEEAKFEGGDGGPTANNSVENGQ